MRTEALLELIDPEYRSRQTVRVTWDHNYDEGAIVDVPRIISSEWNLVARSLQKRYPPGQPIYPYPTMPHAVAVEHLIDSATGAYIIASQLSFGNAKWVKAPPYPDAPIASFGPEELPGTAEEDLEDPGLDRLPLRGTRQ